MVSQAIDLNEQLQNVLARHDALLSGRITVSSMSTSNGNHLNHEEEDEEEEPEQLFRRSVLKLTQLHSMERYYFLCIYIFLLSEKRELHVLYS